MTNANDRAKRTGIQITLRDTARPATATSCNRSSSAPGSFGRMKLPSPSSSSTNACRAVEASGYHFVFAESYDAVAGYACYGPIACTVGSFDLYWIAVDPRFQRHGIGRQLMAAVESRVADAGGQRIYIDTSGKPQYAPTRAFYERSGFHCDARLADFYAPGDDKLIYVKAVGNGSRLRLLRPAAERVTIGHMQKSLDTKLARIAADPSCGDFILADAKDADMAFGVSAFGTRYEQRRRATSVTAVSKNSATRFARSSRSSSSTSC